MVGTPRDPPWIALRKVTLHVDTPRPSEAAMVDVIAYYNATILSTISQRLERDRLLAAVRALRAEGHSVRQIASILWTSYGTVTRALSYRLAPGYDMPSWAPPQHVYDALPEGIYPDTHQMLGRAVWRHSPEAHENFDADLRDDEFSAAEFARERGLSFTCQPQRKLPFLSDVAAPEHHLSSPLPVTAQGVAHALGYKIDGGGHIYDRHEVWVARDLEQLAAALVRLGWIAPGGAGVAWSSFLVVGGVPRDGADDEVRQAVAAEEDAQRETESGSR